MAFGPTKQWKSLCTIHLVIYLNLRLPTDFADEAKKKMPDFPVAVSCRLYYIEKTGEGRESEAGVRSESQM
jgi:hypothetical protein